MTSQPLPPSGKITKPGRYHLEGDHVSEQQFAVHVQADGVELDLRGHTIRSTWPDRKEASFGVYLSGQQNVTVRNGIISGAAFGIHAAGSTRCLVENVRVEVRYVGVSGSPATENLTVRWCQFIGRPDWPIEAYTIGVNAPGSHAVIEGNAIWEMYRQPGAPAGMNGEGCGILLTNGQGSVVIHNVIENSRIDEHSNVGVWVSDQGHATIRGNKVGNFHRGIIAAKSSDILGNTVLLRQPKAESIGVYARTGEIEGNKVEGYERDVVLLATLS